MMEENDGKHYRIASLGIKKYKPGYPKYEAGV
jgi:hypothetical protein